MSTPTTDSPDPTPTRALCACGHAASRHDIVTGCTATNGEYHVCPCRRTRSDAEASALTARVAALEAALAKRCEYHHLPLHNGWSHLVHDRHSKNPRVVRCQLSKEDRALLGGAS